MARFPGKEWYIPSDLLLLGVIYCNLGATLNFHTFSDSGAWRPLLVLQSDLLQRHKVVRQLTPPLEDCSVRALEDRKTGGQKERETGRQAGESGCQGLKQTLHLCLTVRTSAPVEKVNKHSHVPPPVYPVWCRSPTSQIQFLTAEEKGTSCINEGGVLISADKLTDTRANPYDGLAATEGGSKEVKHPPTTVTDNLLRQTTAGFRLQRCVCL